jgi:tRNA A-37 threonylcarbamoyl transferase component Bud32
MGVVAECTHIALNERVAIKMLREDVLLDHEAVERFMREAQAAVKLKSEYVARVSDVGTFENGTPFMVMEYLEGHDLGEMIDTRGHLPVPWAAELMMQTAEALSEAHSIGIVHRDVKPSNLFVTWRPDGTALIKVLDFGISKAPMGNDMQLTQTQSLLGTPAYMSPEQMRSARLVDGRTDIWSLGTVMYELIEGRRPFEAESFSEMCVKVAVDAPQPMTNAPPELQQVILRCLAKNPDQRYASMAELGRDLIPFVNDQHQAAMLVERMYRMLRRSVADVEPPTGTGLRAVPQPIRDVASQPLRAPAWHGGSDAAGAPSRTPAGGVPIGYTAQEPSAPARAPSELHAVPPRRGRFGVILLAAALVGGGGAIAIVMSSGGGGDRPKPAVVEPDHSLPASPAMPVITAPANTVETKPAETKPSGDPATPDIQVETGSGSAAPQVVTDKAAPGTGSGSGSAKLKSKTGSGKIRTTQLKKDPKDAKELPKDTKLPEGPKEPTAECKPFDHPHGCPK